MNIIEAAENYIAGVTLARDRLTDHGYLVVEYLAFSTRHELHLAPDQARKLRNMLNAKLSQAKREGFE